VEQRQRSPLARSSGPAAGIEGTKKKRRRPGEFEEPVIVMRFNVIRGGGRLRHALGGVKRFTDCALSRMAKRPPPSRDATALPTVSYGDSPLTPSTHAGAISMALVKRRRPEMHSLEASINIKLSILHRKAPVGLLMRSVRARTTCVGL
jgi:hypothetical protein